MGFLEGRRLQAGQGLAEYALILAFVAMVAVAAVSFLGGTINDVLSTAANSL